MKIRKTLTVVIAAIAICAGLAWAAVAVSIREWSLPERERFPHDPAAAPDGALWYTAMGSNSIGRLDVSTGKFRSYPLKTKDSGPHGLVADRQGNIWFTANFKGYIGKLDPRSGAVAEYHMPVKEAKDPHTAVFDPAGTLWFTVQNGNFVGRLDTATGKIVLRKPATADARPYGIAVDSAGTPFFCEFGSNKIGRIDPGSLSIREFTLPKGARPRRIAIDSNDLVWYTDYQRGYLGRLDPKTGKVQEWLSPTGADSAPYAMAVLGDGTVWYSETGVVPNTIVRFDPQAENFSRWGIPSGGGVVRHMVATGKGHLYIACSGKNKVGVVRIAR